MALTGNFIQSLKDGKILFTTMVDMDKIIRVFEGSISIPPSTPETDAGFIPTGFTGKVMTRGVFSIDGISWYDVDSFVQSGGADLCGISVTSFNGQLRIRMQSNDPSITHVAQYRIACIYFYDTGIVNTDFMKFYAPISLSTSRNYQKIYDDFPTLYHITGSGTGSVEIPHGLEYIPEFMVYMETNDGAMYDARGAFERTYTAVDEDNMYIKFDTAGVVAQDVIIHSRFYYEHA